MRFHPDVMFCPNELQLCCPHEITHPNDIHPRTSYHIANLSIIKSLTKPDQPGLSSSIRLEVVYL